MQVFSGIIKFSWSTPPREETALDNLLRKACLAIGRVPIESYRGRQSTMNYHDFSSILVLGVIPKGCRKSKHHKNTWNHFPFRCSKTRYTENHEQFLW